MRLLRFLIGLCVVVYAIAGVEIMRHGGRLEALTCEGLAVAWSVVAFFRTGRMPR